MRRPARVVLPPSAYVDMTGLSVPESLQGLELVPGRCHTALSAVRCEQAGANDLCLDCTLLEIGESYELLAARTNAGIAKGKFYRDLDRAQSVPDPEYRRMMEWKRRQNRGTN
jgi:hypothetical protein